MQVGQDGQVGWEFWIDRGGTFTDVVARSPGGELRTHKLLSVDPDRYSDAATEAVRRILGVATGGAVPDGDVDEVRMGTTVATNALLERTGEPTLLLITAGFADALRIGDQHRPQLFTLRIDLPELLYGHVVEVRERVDAAGHVLVPLDVEHAAAELRDAYDSGLRAVAIVLMHGYLHPDHERRLAEVAQRVGFTQVSVSHEVSPLPKLVPRGDTTVVDAYLSPVLDRYIAGVAGELSDVPLAFMQSNGGLADAGAFRGKDAIVSGPAGGVVGMARVAERAGFGQAIGFDMGGTSTDVSLFSGRFERTFDSVVAGVRVRAPMLGIHTVAAGGGSVLQFDGARYRVGPQSAGADPGPACYRRGGPLTVTDANVVLGRIRAEHFPAVFGPGGDLPIDAEASRRLFGELAEKIGAAAGTSPDIESVAAGFVDIAVENMVNAIRRISVQRGHDVTRCVLVSFGGAGGQHACAVADALGIDTVLAHRLAGVLSAYGMGLADRSALRQRAVGLPLDTDGVSDTIAGGLDELAADATAELRRGPGSGDVSVERRVHVRYDGTDTALEVPEASPAQMQDAFEQSYRRMFSFLSPDRALVVEAVSVEATLPTVLPPASPASSASPASCASPDGQGKGRAVVQRDDLARGDHVNGPAVIVEETATTVVDEGWQARVSDIGDLVLRRVTSRAARHAIGTEVDPVRLEIFANRFMAIAEQMGTLLAGSAQSVNIKERLDFSCAVFDPTGGLVANAPHIPVHLGSMGESVRHVLRANEGRIQPGDVYVLNDPYRGGTHLPDVTVVTPVYAPGGDDLWFVVASRGHHADIGGITPGSMPSASRSIDEEGVRLDNVLMVRSGVFREAELRQLLITGPHPARNADQNVGDLRAQAAANAAGVSALLAMVEEFGLNTVQAYMTHVQDNATEAVRRVLDHLDDGECTYELDTGAVIRVAVTVDRSARSAIIDFTGTSAQTADNFNAPPAVTRAAVLYVLRTLVDDDIPLNEGCLVPVSIVIPKRSMLDPSPPAAVVAGNVETSQCVVGALYRALGVMAEAQGTMNNVTFGNERHQYYETVAGGAGAGDGFDGTSCVQTHMTNSRLTDPEVLEARYPVRVESFSIRRDSGGAGRWRGGDGAVRRLRFLEPMRASILSTHRRIAPYGMDGGSPGGLGAARVVSADGSVTELAATDSAEVLPDDVLVVETPGGGGYGVPDPPLPR